MRWKWTLGALIWGWSLFPCRGFAYPEMIRHGYPNCISCHVSPSGGGLLTAYGRALSKEVLSADPSGEEQFLQGSFVPPAAVNLGGEARFLQLFMETPTMSSARGILMQLDLEAAAEISSRLRVVGTLGREEGPRGKANGIADFVISRHHYISALIGPENNKEEHQLRVGRFFPSYGIPLPEHTVVTRRSLGFDQGQESYNAEYAYSGKKINMSATLIEGRPDKLELNRERGTALQFSFLLAQTYKMGLNAFTGKAPQTSADSRRNLLGVHMLLGFSPRFYSLLEVDRTYSGRAGRGLVEFLKLGWEMSKGLHLFTWQEYARSGNLLPKSKTEAYSLGLQYFPKTHWELSGLLREERNTAQSQAYNTVLWLLLHYYL